MADGSHSTEKEFYLLELRKVPADVWSAQSRVEDWFKICTTAGKDGFAPGSLARLPPCPLWIQVERGLQFEMYMLATNFLPFGIPLLPLCRLFSGFPKIKHMAALAALQFVLMRVQTKYWKLLIRWITGEGGEKWRRKTSGELSARELWAHKQLDSNLEVERSNHHYFGTRWILPRSIVEQQRTLPPAILAITPHGILPFGTSGACSKVFGDRVSRWGAAPVLFRVPGIQSFLRRLGCYPAGKSGMMECLANGDHAALILDGIGGMFCGGAGNGDEELYLKERKAVCAIALQAGSPIIPGYCFGTNDAFTVVDPFFGLLRRLSIRLDISLTPFCGRWWIPLGPPARRPMLMCFGEPIPCERLPRDLGKDAMRAAVEAKHAQLLEAYRHIFDTHKAAYGRPHAKLTFA